MRLSPNAVLRPLVAAAGFAALLLSVDPASAAEPIVLSIIDTGGDLASTQIVIENYKKANPDKVKEIKIQRAPAPELPAKIKAQQDAGRLDINLVLTGQDGGAFLAANNQLIKIPNFEKLFPRDDMTPAGKALYDEGRDYMVPSVGNAGGPVFVYNPSKVPNPPKTAEELLAWAKANPGRLMYARPANSGPGRSIVLGMAHILNDSKPLDPDKGWDKTWAYLKELGQYVEYYPTGTAITLKEFAQGQRWIIAGIMEWDMKPRAQSVIPPEVKNHHPPEHDVRGRRALLVHSDRRSAGAGRSHPRPDEVHAQAGAASAVVDRFHRTHHRRRDDGQGAEGHPGTGEGVLASGI